ncbi:hypothetical protein KO525_15105 [Psychrosphaera sp. B3R10]|uniref:DUF6491 family protein n=1 Tax=Psychrosphaera algicola TaxID=3023714 RepID=A0ABT5FF02_9GAMM|nr:MULTISPECIES: DUF6491 family protein [unclassified Psychrosphaera]MBU2880631.1 hypothetical protein [Psychrosphaera sp. I2R16]MBU2990717.1 hypothetical protein [Psychrosphaera sp. B3R10]MDC2890112.1 DUF6491 family protein [Psychrosphaera sp. G1-22]MDO6720838.1 DUF6491 family protein [Psychrosphaera sp. 1_MG-2023]
MFKLILSIIVAGFILVGCASNNTLTKEERTAAYEQFVVDNNLERTDKIPGFKFDQWSSLGAKHLILYRNFRSPYLVTLQRNCFDLDFAHQLAIEHQGGSLRAKFDYVLVPNTIPVKCFISAIHKITPEQKKQLMAIGEDPKTSSPDDAEDNDQEADGEASDSDLESV